ncbi:MAG: putative porin [Thermoanaerobaculales bacterium]|jgi:hypothetical protein|nr:putative porin [Thermoanaerobaculales bacterium]
MNTWWKALATALVLCLALPAFATAEEPEMDPLLELLVEQGVITAEQAAAVQAEYARREAAKAAEAKPPEVLSTDAPQVATAEPLPAPDSDAAKTKKWYDRIDFKADLRLRYEDFWVEGISDNNFRQRERLRIRAGIYAPVTDWMRVGVQVRSGDPLDPVSDNQSVDGGFTMKQIAFSEGFADFTPLDWFRLHVGKFDPKKLWKVSDFQWDDDVTVEGMLQNFEVGAFSASAYQYALEERKEGDDSFLFGGQVRGTFDVGAGHSFVVGVGYDDWVNPQYVADLTLNGKIGGNRVTNLLDTNDQLISDFQIGNLFAEWKYRLSERWPITLTAFGYHNFGAAEYDGRTYDDGYFIRFQIGDYKEKGHVAFRASRYFSQPDALFYVFTQSDTTMSSDVDGYRFDLRLGFVMRSYFNFTWYHTEPASDLQDIPTMDRLQVDYIIRF